jgi:hypothetical protein
VLLRPPSLPISSSDIYKVFMDPLIPRSHHDACSKPRSCPRRPSRPRWPRPPNSSGRWTSSRRNGSWR